MISHGTGEVEYLLISSGMEFLSHPHNNGTCSAANAKLGSRLNKKLCCMSVVGNPNPICTKKRLNRILRTKPNLTHFPLLTNKHPTKISNTAKRREKKVMWVITKVCHRMA
jgi:hypothetical protein